MGTPHQEMMRLLRKPEIVFAALAVAIAGWLLFTGGEVEEIPTKDEEVTVPRHGKSSSLYPRRAKSERERPMPSLSRWPTGKIESVNKDFGFVVIKADALKLQKGSRAFVEGVSHEKIWLEIESAQDGQLIANLRGTEAATLRRGERVYFPQLKVVLSETPTVDPRTIRWTNPDGGWAD